MSFSKEYQELGQKILKINNRIGGFQAQQRDMRRDIHSNTFWLKMAFAYIGAFSAGIIISALW